MQSDGGNTPEGSFGRRVREEREARHWTQDGLASLLRQGTPLRLDPTAVTRLERGTRAIRLNEAVYLAQMFGLLVTDMLGPAVPLDAAIERAEAQIDQERARVRQAESSLKAAKDNLARLEKLNAPGQPVTVHLSTARAVVDLETFRKVIDSVMEARAAAVPKEQLDELINGAFEEHSKTTAAAAKVGD